MEEVIHGPSARAPSQDRCSCWSLPRHQGRSLSGNRGMTKKSNNRDMKLISTYELSNVLGLDLKILNKF